MGSFVVGFLKYPDEMEYTGKAKLSDIK